MADLHTSIFWLAVLIFAVVSGMLSYSIIRFQGKSRYDVGIDRLSVIWTLVPIAILVALLVFTFQSIQAAP
jgi:heme/copper-type cytochrome/quinol oxidase subunit 2